MCFFRHSAGSTLARMFIAPQRNLLAVCVALAIAGLVPWLM
jgi:hypothetical protein